MPTGPREEFMVRAGELALQGVKEGIGGPFGAVIVKDGAIVATGENRVLSTNDPTAHAEVVAIRAASAVLGTFELRGCELYASCEPCPMCLAAALWARVDRVYFAATREDARDAGFDDAEFYDEIARPLNERTLPVEGFLRESSRAALDYWKTLDGKTPY